MDQRIRSDTIGAMMNSFTPPFPPRRSLSILAIASVLTFGSIVSPRAEEASVDKLLEHFDSVVFGSEYAEVKSAERVQKWISPIRVSISTMQGKMINKPGGGRELKLEHARPSSAQVAKIRKHLTTLVKITGAVSEKSDKKITNQQICPKACDGPRLSCERR